MEKTFSKFKARFEKIGRSFLIAVVASRLQPGFNLPIGDDGKSLKDIGLEGLGVRRNPETGELKEIQPTQSKT